MALVEEIKKIAAAIPAEVKEKKDRSILEFVVAERKAFLSKKKLTYRVQFKISESPREIVFTEALMESGVGLAGGGDADSGISPGFGFKVEKYSSGAKGRSGTIEEQSTLFGQKYQYKFDYKKIRVGIEAAAKEEGYQFTYKALGL